MGKKKSSSIFDIYSGATFECKKVKGQAMNFWGLNF
jgi:hypothetical protein